MFKRVSHHHFTSNDSRDHQHGAMSWVPRLAGTALEDSLSGTRRIDRAAGSWLFLFLLSDLLTPFSRNTPGTLGVFWPIWSLNRLRDRDGPVWSLPASWLCVDALIPLSAGDYWTVRRPRWLRQHGTLRARPGSAGSPSVTGVVRGGTAVGRNGWYTRQFAGVSQSRGRNPRTDGSHTHRRPPATLLGPPGYRPVHYTA